MALVDECLSFFGTESLQVARDRLQSLTASQIPDELSALVRWMYFLVGLFGFLGTNDVLI